MNGRYRHPVTARLHPWRRFLAVGVLSAAAATAVTLSAMSSPAVPEVAKAPTSLPDLLARPAPPPPLKTTKSGDGFVVIKPVGNADNGRGSGKATGWVVPYSVEFEPGLRSHARQLSEIADEALQDPKRGWNADGSRTLLRVAQASKAQVRVVLASPATVDAHCARVGLNTAGIFSCWDGQRAMINLYRWTNGASDFNSLGTYRRYVINHEVGHGLGFGHHFCPTAGAPAPVMMQQSKGTYPCKANPWPNP
jgi:hypothetical protein